MSGRRIERSYWCSLMATLLGAGAALAQGGPGGPPPPPCPMDQSCCEPGIFVGCDDVDCCEAVCAIDAFCCSFEWDAGCVGLAQEFCDGCLIGDPCPGVGFCCDANGTPGCDDAACCELVCSVDPFCCDIEWDLICASGACELCGDDGTCDCFPGACCLADGSCVTTNAPDCELQGGEFFIFEDCGSSPCGVGVCPGEGSCCDANGTPGCDDAACCELICGLDPFCCDIEWDSICVNEAAASCGGLCGGCPGDVDGDADTDSEDLNLLLGEFGCGTKGPGARLCAADLDGDGDVDSADLNILLGGFGCGFVAPCPGEGDCCEPNGTPGCEEAACCELICELAPFCCEIGWDLECVDLALENCLDTCVVVEPNCAGGDCCAPNGTPGCEDLGCCWLICGADPFCCDVEWDQICADAAADECTGLCEPAQACGPDAGCCCEANGTPGCDQVECCEIVCGVDPFCCDIEWDLICFDEAVDLCPELFCPGDSDCCSANGSPGCDDAQCAGIICSLDEFCCLVEWDQICADQAANLCPVCGGSPPPTGACCLPDGGCVQFFEVNCFLQGGLYQGDGVACDDPGVECEFIGVCCIGPTCLLVGEAECLKVGGLYIDGVNCAVPGICDEPFPGECPGDGDCCEPNGSPGCVDELCCSVVCAQDPFCCEVEWDPACVEQALGACLNPCGLP